MQDAITRYLDEITEQFYSGHAIEHAYRPALKVLMSFFEDTIAVNDPKHSEHGAPDFVFLKKSNTKIIKGYAEAKDITVSLDKTERTDQMQRYGGYANLILTDYLEFRFFKNGDKYQTISLGKVKDGKLYKTPENGERLARELAQFLTLPPEKIRSGKRLAQIMGGKARRIRDNVIQYLADGDDGSELDKMYLMMKQMLVHDLTPEKFADMYAQTLVYGLFVARYGDTTPDTFSRSEARDLVPASNPFLRHFFDHIVGPNFDVRLGYIVDELCEVFSVSNVLDIVHKHLRIQDETIDVKDPIIHFYEEFLHEYDPLERKRMGAYYTPIPVVKFIVRQVDTILKEEFGITKGLASSESFKKVVDKGQEVDIIKTMKTGRQVKSTSRFVEEDFYRVQILDPAVGTATFLNETIKFIHDEFKGQEGRWPAYVADNLVKRLHGFELMMAPYTIAHLKLGMTLRETGVDKIHERLGVYLTNTLEEGIPTQPDLFSFGLAQAVSDESQHAAEIKSERPIMVVMGNPPYSVSSNNKSKYIDDLLKVYKKDLNERNIQPLSDDYIKFIRFAENMIDKNGEGIVAMITNNSFIDGTIHRQMRSHLMKTFSSIYILDLHGSLKKKEISPDGSKDENVFDIQQGVSINIFVKKSTLLPETKVKIYHSEIYGTRLKKFEQLSGDIQWSDILVSTNNNFFKPFNESEYEDYKHLVPLDKLFLIHNAGTATGKDSLLVGDSKNELTINLMNNEIQYNEESITKYYYRPFDTRYLPYDKSLIQRLRTNVMKHVYGHSDNISLLATQKNRQISDLYASLSDAVVDRHLLDSAGDSMHVFPLWLYHEDGTRTANFDSAELSALTRNLTVTYAPEDILDYIYATLHSPTYRETYKEFLKIDFPRIPVVVNDTEFIRLVALGRELRELHLMKTSVVDEYTTTFPVQGNNEMEKLKYEDEKVWINTTQYFGNVPEIAWNFYIGGYQPAQKWLKDRKGRELSDDDLDHYQKIIKILCETDRIMKQIDQNN